ncbi:MAG: M48 family metalloprotease [Candidatus Puniceispirillaceae bacterium]
MQGPSMSRRCATRRLLSAARRAVGLFAVILCAGISAASAGMIRDSEIETGLQTLIAPLSAAAGFAPDEIAVRVVLDPDYNAFVAGKRVIYVHSGLLAEARDIREYLGVMAHELGHLKEGHVQRLDDQLQQANNTATAATLAAIALAAGGGSGDAAAGLLIGGNDTAVRGFLASRRRNEAVADEIGMDLLEATGTSAIGLRDLMARMTRQRSIPESRQSAYYSTHPGAAERLRTLQDHVNRSPHSEKQASSKSVEIYKRLTAKLRAWTEPPQRMLSRASELAPNEAVARYMMAIAEFRRGDLGASLAHMDGLVSDFPQDPFFHEFRADILFAMARPQQAAVSYEIALSHLPGSVLLKLSLGRALIAIGAADGLTRAAAVLREARDTEPRWAFLHRQYGIALGKLGRIAEADLALADEAIILGDRRRAAQLAKRVMSRDDIDQVVKSRASDILFRYGRDNE